MKLSERLDDDAESFEQIGDIHGTGKLLREAAELARKVEQAPVGNVGDVGKGHRWVRIRGELPSDMHGRRVAIVGLDDTP